MPLTSLFTTTAHAQSLEEACKKLNTFESVIIDPLIMLLFLAAMIYFFWGMVVFMSNTDDPDKRKDGKSTMIWGVVGFTIMVSVFGILKFISSFVGADGALFTTCK